MKKALFLIICLAVMVPFALVPSFAQMRYKEAPMLAEMVRVGKLPSVEKRLPEVPYVVETDEIGRYGGTLRTVRPSPDRDADVALINIRHLLDPPELSISKEIRGSVLQNVEASRDSRVFTFHMRKGLKWSDGQPVTTEDVLFNYEDVLMNDKLTPAFPRVLMAGGKPLKLEVMDSYTFRISFDEPYGGFIDSLRWWLRGYTTLIQPKHYLRNFHPRYTPMDELEAQISKAGLAKGEWWALFQSMSRFETIGRPTVEPWIVVNKQVGEVEYERNPYYWRVDKEGNQLPYIDRIKSTLVANPEASVLKVIAGEVDFMREIANLDKVPIYKENEGKGRYRTMLYKKDVSTVLVLNLSHSDPVWRQVVRDPRFRRALNMAINRKEIIDAVYLGMASPAPEVPSDYNLTRANQLLDEAGLGKRDSEGWRLGPDGKRFTIHLDVAQLMGFEVPTTELIVESWQAAGIRTTMRTVDFGLWATLGSSNEIKASVHWTSNMPAWRNTPVTNIDAFVPDQYRSWGPAWRQWYNTRGKEGEEPPGEVKRIFELRDVIMQTVSPEERTKATDEIARLEHDNVFWIGLAWPDAPVIYSANLGNIPSRDDGDSHMALIMGERLFFRR
jgi:peptide/nickel transport system substrate-binding protein